MDSCNLNAYGSTVVCFLAIFAGQRLQSRNSKCPNYFTWFCFVFKWKERNLTQNLIQLEITILEEQVFWFVFRYPYPNNVIFLNITRLLDLSFCIIQ